MANYRLMQNERTKELKIQKRMWDPRNETYWQEDCPEVGLCPQDIVAARKLVRQLNNPPKWIDVTEG